MALLDNNRLTSPFLSATHWAEQEVFDHLHQSLKSQFASLTDAEQRRYRQLAHQYSTATKNVEREDKRLKEAFQTEGVARIRAKLLALTGKDLDPLKVYIHTRYLHTPQRPQQFPQRLRRSLDATEDEPLPEPLPLLDEGTPMAYVLSMTLWEAACSNYGFLAYFASYRSDSLVNASFINESPGIDFRTAQLPDNIDTTSIIPANTFIDVARSLNLGEALQVRIVEALLPDASLHGVLGTQTKAHLQFSLMEFYRTCGPNPQKRAAVKALSDAMDSESSALKVTQIVLTIKFTAAELLSGQGFHPQRGFSISSRLVPTDRTDAHQFIIPFYQIELPGTEGMFSFFPGRPAGELRWHSSQTHLITDMRNQLLRDRAEKNLDWFRAQLSEEILGKLMTVVPEPAGAGNFGFNIQGQLPRIRRDWVVFDDLGFKAVRHQTSLEAPLFYFHCGLYANRALQMAQERSIKDWEDLVSAVSTLFDELSGLLLIPVPGATKGLSKVILLLFLGSTVKDVFSALEQSFQGDHSGGAQLLLDALDMLVTPLLHRKAGALAQRRHAQLLQQMGQPRTFIRADGRTDLWQSDPARFAGVPASVTDNMALDEQGIYRHSGRDYVFLEKDGQRYVVEVVRNPDGTWRAIAKVEPGAYRPPVVWDEAQRRWQLALDDSPGLSDSQLLCRMVSGMTAQAAQRALAVSAVSRADLQVLWAGGHAPAALTDAVTRFQADLQLQRCADGLNRYEHSPSVIERPVLALIPRLDCWPKDSSLIVLDSDSPMIEMYGQTTQVIKSLNGVWLKRLDDGELVSTTSSLLKAFPDDLLSALIKQLSLPTDALQMSRLLISQLNEHKEALFTALTVNKDALPVDGLPTSRDLTYLPLDSPRKATIPPAIFDLRKVHPSLTMARCYELLRLYPDLANHGQHLHETLERRALMGSKRLPESVHEAVRKAEFSSRVECLLDAVYHPRGFNPVVDQCLQELCTSKLKQWFDVDLIIYPPSENVVAGAGFEKYRKNELGFVDHGAGRYWAYDMQLHTPIPAVAGPDSFFAALIAGLVTSPRIKSQLSAAQVTVGGWRQAMGDELVAQRTPDGFIDTAHPQVERYALADVDASSQLEQDAQGIYTHNGRPCVGLDFHCYEVQSPTDGWVNAIIDSSRFARAPIPVYGNGEGAWRHHYEQPMEWDGQYLLQRLGYRASGFNSDQITGILHVSNTTEDMLRRVHVNREPVPPLLVDTLQRFRHVQRLETLVVKRDEQVERSLFDDIADAFDGAHPGLLAKLTSAQLGALRQSMRPGDTYFDLLTDTPDELRYVHALYHYLIRSTGGVTPALFDAVAQVSENQPGRRVALLKRVFPGLPACIASDLVRSANRTETRQLREQGRVPLRLAEEARVYLRELRVNRAIEGFYLPALQNNDSVRLMLDAFGKQPGWSATLKVEVREGSVNGTLLSQLGPDNGAVQLTLVRTGQGWQAFSVPARDLSVSPQDFFTTLLAALPDAERTALGDNYAGGSELLKEKLTLTVIQNREQINSTLGMVAKRPWFAPPQRLADGRIGYSLSGRGDATDRFFADLELRKRYEKIFPASSANYDSVRALEQMRSRGLDVEQELTRLEGQARALQQQLTTWIEQKADFETYDYAAQFHKHDLANALIKAWRKEASVITGLSGNESGYRLELKDWRVSTLPVLSADFSHIRELTLTGLRVGAGMALGVESNINQFLRLFGSLRSLKVEDCRFARLPQALGQLSSLVELSLAGNRVPFQPTDQQALAGLVNLQYLNLHGCVLSGRLDVTQLTELRELNLSQTQSSTWPMGVMQLPHLTHLDLSHNQISTVPPEVLDGPQAINRVTSLRDNPLTAAAIEQLQVYQARTGINFGLHLEADHPGRLAFDHGVWLDGLDADERQMRLEQCQMLREEPRALRFFQVIDDLKTTADFDAEKHDLVRRVQRVLEAATESERIRKVLFDRASKPTECCDSVSLLFSRLETQVLVFKALADDDPVRAETSLARLIRGQFRLKVLDAFAVEDASQRSDAPDVLEIGFTYRLRLAEALELPAQPHHMRFPSLGIVEPQAIERVRVAILAMDNSVPMLDHMINDPFWDEFLRARYAQQFDALYNAHLTVVDDQDVFDTQSYDNALLPLRNRLTLQALANLNIH